MLDQLVVYLDIVDKKVTNNSQQAVRYCFWCYLVVLENRNIALQEQQLKPWFHVKTRSPAIAEGPRDAGVPVEIW